MPSVPSQTINAGQVAVGTSGAIAVPARADRKRVTLIVAAAAAIGNSAAVTTGTGALLPANVPVTLETAAAIYAVAGSATTLSYVEEFA